MDIHLSMGLTGEYIPTHFLHGLFLQNSSVTHSTTQALSIKIYPQHASVLFGVHKMPFFIYSHIDHTGLEKIIDMIEHLIPLCT